jgi:8-oxo-dGTP pyrophosphatase MutT (NUDIX family)
VRIQAAGAVLWRPAGRGVEVALVHRPKYGDWSLPKGKLGDGETPFEAARREVAEETGQDARAGPELGEVRYPVRTRDGAPAEKVVRYWAMEAVGGTFEPTREVDAVRWLPPEEAAGVLTYQRDREILARFVAWSGG